jgi:SAM-dependent methyltransferase
MLKGWFVIPGVQHGVRDLRERTDPLRPLLAHTRGATILDLGCAEGMISKWLVDEGRARLVHGLELHPPYVETARKMMPRPQYKARFDVCDLNHFERDTATAGLLPGYDIVLALNVIQKLFDPRAMLLKAAGYANKFFVYSGPAAVIRDNRSNFVEVDVQKELLNTFKLIHVAKGEKSKKTREGHLGIRLIFERIAP